MARERPHQAKQFHVRFIERGKGKVVVERERGEEREGEGGAFLYICMVMWSQVKVGGEPNGFWKYGGRCLGNRCAGCAVAYVTSQVSEVLIPAEST